MTSIRQNHEPPRLPNFANLGVWLRILLGVNGLAMLIAFARNRMLVELPGELAPLAASVEPPLIASLALLYLLHRQVEHRAYAVGAAVVIAVALLTTAGSQSLFSTLDTVGGATESLMRSLVWAALCATALLLYFEARSRLQSPALAEARLLALTARIRPHFLFNALNAVLGVIRSDPRRAEGALEELADLFRVLMRENRELVPLSEEIALARQYLNLERLRLGDRLRVNWDIESCPPDALVPPLMLQPLLENAVYHGIEPAEEPGEISIHFARRGDQLLVELTNPYSAGASHHAGNHMALANIRERLMLFYDLEARLQTFAEDGRYRVRIVTPYRSGETA